jgi:hypothetical protein
LPGIANLANRGIDRAFPVGTVVLPGLPKIPLLQQPDFQKLQKDSLSQAKEFEPKKEGDIILNNEITINVSSSDRPTVGTQIEQQVINSLGNIYRIIEQRKK